MKKQRLVIGKILKAQGVKGEVKVAPLTDDADRFLKLKKVYFKDQLLNVKTTRVAAGYAYLSFSEFEDRSALERNGVISGEISVDRSDAVELEDGRYFIADVLDCEFRIDGKRVGYVYDIHQYSSIDNYVIKLDDGRELEFPALEDVFLEMNIDKSFINVDSQKLDEIAVYED